MLALLKQMRLSGRHTHARTLTCLAFACAVWVVSGKELASWG